MILLADSEGPDQTVRMRRLMCVFALRIYFAWRGLYDSEAQINALSDQDLMCSSTNSSLFTDIVNEQQGP